MMETMIPPQVEMRLRMKNNKIIRKKRFSMRLDIENLMAYSERTEEARMEEEKKPSGREMGKGTI